MNSTFCTDLVSLFVNHLWECDECLFKVFGYLIYFVLAVAVIFFVISCFCDFVCKFFSTLFARFSFRKKYNELEAEFEHLNDSYSELLVDYNSLGLKYADLEKEYYHTCN